MRVFFVVALASTAFNCKCEDSVRKALDEKRPEPPSVPEVVSKATAENEPNDAPEKATKIELGHELRPLHAELSSPSDIDWFSLSSTVSESEIIELRVSPDKVETNLSLHVQSGADSAPPLTYDVGGAGEAEVIAALKIGKTPLKFAVRASGAGVGAYTLQATRRMGEGIEAEPNDDVTDATEASVPSQIQGLIDRPDDRDVYRIVAKDQPRSMSIAFEPVQGVTQILRIFDSDRLADSLASLQFSGTQGEQGGIPAFRLEAGMTAYIVVTTMGGFDRKAPYRLALNELVDLADSVEVEPNDRMPIPMAVPGTLRGGFYAAEDVDRITLGAVVPPAPSIEIPSSIIDAGSPPATDDAGVPDGGVPYEFRAKPTSPPPLVFKVEALREGDVIGVTFNLPSGEHTMVLDPSKRDTSFCVPAFISGDAEVVIRPVQMSSAGGLAYALEAKLLEGPNVESEPNDDVVDADELVSRRTGFFDAGAADVYGVRVEGDVSHVVLTLTDAPALEMMELVDEEEALIATASQGRIEVDLPAGMYFVRLRGRPECLPYNLAVQRKPNNAATGEK